MVVYFCFFRSTLPRQSVSTFPEEKKRYRQRKKQKYHFFFVQSGFGKRFFLLEYTSSSVSRYSPSKIKNTSGDFFFHGRLSLFFRFSWISHVFSSGPCWRPFSLTEGSGVNSCKLSSALTKHFLSNFKLLLFAIAISSWIIFHKFD